MYSGNAPYRLSKLQLNSITRMASYELKDKNILVNSVCPGFVATGPSLSPLLTLLEQT